MPTDHRELGARAATGDLYFALEDRHGVVDEPEGRQACFAVRAESPDRSPARLNIVAEVTGEVRISGIARLANAGHVRVRRSTTVVAADDAVVTLKRHVRIKRMDLSLDDLRDRAGRELATFVRDGDVEQFRSHLRRLVPRARSREGDAERPIKVKHDVDIRECQYVELRDGSTTDIDNRVVLERTVLPLVEMLVDDAELCRSLRAALREAEPGRETTAFLRRALRVAGRAEEDEVLRGARTSEDSDARLHELFGTARVRGAELVVVGAGNKLRSDTRLRRPGFDREPLSRELDRLRRERADQATEQLRRKPVDQVTERNLDEDTGRPIAKEDMWHLWDRTSRDDHDERGRDDGLSR
jgi:hypothetical protein